MQRAVAQETTVCVYDRAGLGWSDSPPWRRTVRAMAMSGRQQVVRLATSMAANSGNAARDSRCEKLAAWLISVWEPGSRRTVVAAV